MSRRLDAVFARLKRENRKALVVYLTAGDPDYETSLALLEAACKAGTDVLELGVPFSDPTSDGPVIQAASLRALQGGMTVARALALTRDLRRRVETPIVLFSYYNPLLNYGIERLGREAREAGADGFLVVDLPPEESAEFIRPLGPDLPLIRLIAPTTPPDRVHRIAAGAGGFLYAITRTGVTGDGALDLTEVGGEMAVLREAAGGLPICLGFGIRTAADVRALAPLADGVVVGSALVRLIEEGRTTPATLPAMVADRVRELATALRAAVAR